MSRGAAASPAALAEVLLVGCEGSGKSCLARQLAHIDDFSGEEVSLAAAPTNGIERDEVCDASSGVRFWLKEVGGSLKSTWAGYARNAAAIVFVLDVSNVHQLGESVFELAQLLHNATLRSKPIVLALNKTDALGALSRTDLQLSLRLDDLLLSARGGASERSAADGSVTVAECSAVKPAGLKELLGAIVKALQQSKEPA